MSDRGVWSALCTPQQKSPPKGTGSAGLTPAHHTPWTCWSTGLSQEHLSCARFKCLGECWCHQSHLPSQGAPRERGQCSEKLETEEPELRGPRTYVEPGTPPTAVITPAPCSKPCRVGVTSPTERASWPDPRRLDDTRRPRTGGRARVPAHVCAILPFEAASLTPQSQEQRKNSARGHRKTGDTWPCGLN